MSVGANAAASVATRSAIPLGDDPLLDTAVGYGLDVITCPEGVGFPGYDDQDDVVYVGAARVAVATDDRGRVKNDVILEMAITEVEEVLYVFVDGSDTHAVVNYTSELLNVTWDLATALGKQRLDIKVVSDATSPHAWDEVFALPDLGVVYGEHNRYGHAAKWLPRANLLPVAYRSPASALNGYFDGGVTYFDDLEVGCSRHAVIIVNGVFDHLHNGHKKLLSLAASVCGERLVVGVTAANDVLDTLAFSELIEPLATRKKNVRSFVESLNSELDIEIVDVVDKWGPAAVCTDNRALLLVPSSDMAQCLAVQSRRTTTGLPFLLSRIVRRTDRSILSSRHIRATLAAAP